MTDNKSMIVAMTDFRMAMKVKFVKYGFIGMGALGPILVILMTAVPLFFLPPGAETNQLLALMFPLASSMLALFSIIPATMLSANALVGEREQNTLEPLLCTPLSDRELLWGKSLSTIIPCGILLLCNVLVVSLAINVVRMIQGQGFIMFPDIPGLFLILVISPILIAAIVAVMIIISGRVQRVYEAYQMSGGVIMVFMIPLLGSILGATSGSVDISQTWVLNIITLLIVITLAAVSWFVALRRFNRDHMVALV